MPDCYTIKKLKFVYDSVHDVYFANTPVGIYGFEQHENYIGKVQYVSGDKMETYVLSSDCKTDKEAACICQGHYMNEVLRMLDRVV